MLITGLTKPRQAGLTLDKRRLLLTEQDFKVSGSRRARMISTANIEVSSASCANILNLSVSNINHFARMRIKRRGRCLATSTSTEAHDDEGARYGSVRTEYMPGVRIHHKSSDGRLKAGFGAMTRMVGLSNISTQSSA